MVYSGLSGATKGIYPCELYVALNLPTGVVRVLYRAKFIKALNH